jgi:hypothetical protein
MGHKDGSSPSQADPVNDTQKRHIKPASTRSLEGKREKGKLPGKIH